MVDLLTHVLVAYALATSLSIRYAWVSPPLVTVAMMGAVIPDLSRLSLLVAEETVTSLFGIPFAWFGFHTLGGVVVASLVGVVLASKEYRPRVALLLPLGAGTHLVLDALLVKPSGVAAPLWWPLAAHGTPTPGLYLSTDRWPVLVAGGCAASVWGVRYRILGDGDK
ncbi:metal-dependent hydrolase [Natronomonas halophila]|uniref:metal-dependent hydrolase n=1 Tax=Natronomonas halophila TaxID=2747817 RepID=UPI0015B49692|nr:metal-dependent hydrolase [Natronomonas halophila]QLD87070.1 metal-dependent hydrolase [Natronomonas halophila]